MRLTIYALSVFALNPAGAGVFQEKGGVVAIEAESTDSSLGAWKKKTDVAGYSGECHIEFTGNKAESGPPKSPLKYKFQITKPGEYTLSIRARKRLESKRQDISNDCYVALSGDFTAGGEAPLNVLKSDTKMFGGNADGWGWTRSLDRDHKKFPAVYNLKAGETYEMTISGRSKNFNIDRFILVHADADMRKVQRDNPPESAGGGLGGGFKERTRRVLTNTAGAKIEAELLGKEDGKVTCLVKGRRYTIALDTLSEADREFIGDWEP